MFQEPVDFLKYFYIHRFTLKVTKSHWWSRWGSITLDRTVETDESLRKGRCLLFRWGQNFIALGVWIGSYEDEDEAILAAMKAPKRWRDRIRRTR